MSLDTRPQALDVLPSEQERDEFGLTLKNGVELQLGRQDPLLITANPLINEYQNSI
jgi:hypothetical protein